MAAFDGKYAFYRLLVGPVWARETPAADAPWVGYEKEGAEITVVRREGNWVLRAEGGWMMVDGREKGLGVLLEELTGQLSEPTLPGSSTCTPYHGAQKPCGSGGFTACTPWARPRYNRRSEAPVFG